MSPTRQSLLLAATELLVKAGCDTPRLDAEILLAHCEGIERTALYLDMAALPSAACVEGYEALIARRARREPVARILGARDFWKHSFYLNEATLVPRPDSETLVEAALPHLAAMAAPLVVDFGTGSGCLLLSLLDEVASAKGLGLDLAPRALDAAVESAKAIGVAGRAGFKIYDWNHDPLPVARGCVDMVISNPPYIRHDEKPELSEDVRDYDPSLALFADEGGLAAYKCLIPIAHALLRAGGYAFFEVGQGQAARVQALLQAGGFEGLSVYEDLGGVKRVVSGVKG